MMERTKTKNTTRRYPIGKHPIYDNVFDQAVETSSILNEKNANKINNDHWNDWDTALYMLEGDPDHDHYYKLGANGWKPSLILSAKADLKDAHSRFDNWAKEQQRIGKILTKPTTWPQPLLELRLSREAVLDARKKEANFIRSERKRMKGEEKRRAEKERLARMLHGGPLGQMEGDLIDGQRIAYNEEDIPYIDEPNSPYHGMPLFYYRQMAEKWVDEQGLSITALLEKRNELFDQERAKAMARRENPRTLRQNIKHFKEDYLSGFTKDDFPEWPKEAKPIHELEVVRD